MSTLKIKDGDIADKYLDTIGAGTLLDPHQSVVPDYAVSHAINQIFQDDGVTVSVRAKGKSLVKFGENKSLASGVSETVWITGGDETFKTANDIDIVVSDDAGDTQNIVIEGHTISGSDFTFVSQTATLNGTTNVTLSTPLARVSRLYNDDSTDFAGTITVEDSGTSTHLTVDSGNQSEKCATTLSSQDYWIVTRLTIGVERSNTANVDFQLQVRESGKVFRTISIIAGSNGSAYIKYDHPIIVKPNSDVRVLATSNAASTSVNCTIHGFLAIIIP